MVDYIIDSGVEVDSDSDYKWWNEDEFLFDDVIGSHIFGITKRQEKTKDKQRKHILNLFKNLREVNDIEESHLIIAYKDESEMFTTFFRSYKNEEFKPYIENKNYKIIYLQHILSVQT